MGVAWRTIPIRASGRAKILEAARGRVGELMLLLAVAVPVLFGSLDLALLDPDEGLYADITRTMLVSGDWVLPRFNGLPYLEKPPLFFWLGTLTLALDGSAEWTLRVWSALAALGTVLLAWRIAHRLYGRPAGLVAGLALATTAGYALYVRKASTDFVFVFCLTLTLYGFLRDTERAEAGRSRFLLAYVGAALAVLSKGLIGLVFPLAIIGLGLAWVRRLSWRDLNLLRGGAMFAVLAMPWHLVVAWRFPDLFHFYLIDNQILRFLNRRAFLEDDVPMSTLMFLVVSFVWLFPWGVFVLARPERAARPETLWRPVLVIWAVVVIGFFALSGSKLEYYALPAFPACAVLVGGAWQAGRDIGRWLVVGLIGSLLVGLAAVWIGAGLTAAQTLAGLAELNVYYRILRDQGAGLPYASPGPFGTLLQGLGATLVGGWCVAAACWWRGWRRATLGALVAQGAVIALLIVQVLQLVEPHHSAREVSHAIRAVAGGDDVVAHEGSLEYSAALPFYTGRRIVVVDGVRGDLELASRRPEARGYFLDTERFAALWGGPRRVFLVTQRPRDRSVAGGLPVETVYLFGRFGSRWLYSNRGG